MFVVSRIIVLVCVLVIWNVDVCIGGEFETKGDQEDRKNKSAMILDLKSAGRTALGKNPDIDIAKARIQQAGEAVKIAMASYYPDVSIQCSVDNNRMSGSAHDKNKALASITGSDINNPEMNYNAGLSITWIIFNGFGRKYNYIKQASALSMSQYKQFDSERVLLSAVSQSYYTAQLARENIDIARADGFFYSRQLEDANARNIAGTGSLSDVINFQVRGHSAEAEIIRAEYEYEAAMSALAALMGYQMAVFPVETTLAGLEYNNASLLNVPDMALLTENAFENRPDIREYKYALLMAESSVSIEKSQFLPIVWMEGTVGGSRAEDAAFRQDDIGNSVSLNVSCNLFSGGANRASLKRARALYREKQRLFEWLKIQIRSEIKQSFVELESSLQQYSLYKRNALLVKQNRALVEMEYRAGKCSLVRLNEAQRDYTATRNRMALAFVSTCQARFRLDAVTGNIRRLFKKEGI